MRVMRGLPPTVASGFGEAVTVDCDKCDAKPFAPCIVSGHPVDWFHIARCCNAGLDGQLDDHVEEML